MGAQLNFILCDYFNAKGKKIESIFISLERDPDQADTASELLARSGAAAALEQMKAEAAASGETTGLEEAALALNALLGQVIEEEVSIHDARKINAISVNFKKSVTIAEIVPVLDMDYGANSASWARGVFSHLNLGHPGVQ